MAGSHRMPSVLAAAGLAALSSTSLAQVRLELRLMAQTGSPPLIVTDLASSTHPVFSGFNQRKRFELQYRLVDTDPTDGLSPCGLSALQFNITSAQSRGGADTWTLDRAQLTRFEAQLASSIPPASPDSSGLPTAAMTTARGLHTPFRTALPSPAPNNDAPANGALSGVAISMIVPLALSSPNQGPCGGPDTGAWFGLYSFDVVLPIPPAADITLTVTPMVDAQTGTAFHYFDDSGNSAPAHGTQFLSATGLITGDPGPPPATTCCNGRSCILVTSPQTCASGWSTIGPGNLCANAPNPCCPADINGADGVTLQDLFDYLTLWFTSDPRADFNHLGGVTLQDLFDYLGAWFAGC